MIILRDFSRTLHDDFELHVRSHIPEGYSATPLYGFDNQILGWIIKPLYE